MMIGPGSSFAPCVSLSPLRHSFSESVLQCSQMYDWQSPEAFFSRYSPSYYCYFIFIIYLFKVGLFLLLICPLINFQNCCEQWPRFIPLQTWATDQRSSDFRMVHVQLTVCASLSGETNISCGWNLMLSLLVFDLISLMYDADISVF